MSQMAAMKMSDFYQKKLTAVVEKVSCFSLTFISSGKRHPLCSVLRRMTDTCHILLFKSVYVLKLVSPWHGPKDKLEVDLHDIPWHTTKRTDGRPAFTMHHPEDQLWAFLHDMTRLGGNLEVHLHGTPTRRGWGLAWGLPSQCMWHD